MLSSFLDETLEEKESPWVLEDTGEGKGSLKGDGWLRCRRNGVRTRNGEGLLRKKMAPLGEEGRG